VRGSRQVYGNVPVPVDADAVWGNDHEKQVVVELCGIDSSETAGAQMRWRAGMANLSVPAAIGAYIVVAVEDPTKMIGESFGIINREPARTVELAHALLTLFLSCQSP